MIYLHEIFWVILCHLFCVIFREFFLWYSAVHYFTKYFVSYFSLIFTFFTVTFFTFQPNVSIIANIVHFISQHHFADLDGRPASRQASGFAALRVRLSLASCSESGSAAAAAASDRAREPEPSPSCSGDIEEYWWILEMACNIEEYWQILNSKSTVLRVRNIE